MNFDRQITLYSRATPSISTQDGNGEHTLALSLVVQTMAEKVYKRGGEKPEAGQEVASTVELFRIRYRSLTNVHVLVCDGKTYDILSIEEEGRKHTLVIECERKDSQ